MPRVRYLAALSATLLTLATRADAQSDSLVPGQRVRLVAPGAVAGRVEGTVLQRPTDTLVVGRRDGVSLRVPLRAITDLQLSRGESRGRGALRGAKLGASIVGGAGLVLTLPALTGADSVNTRSDAVSFTAQSVLSGALWGALIGAFVPAERWAHVAPPARVSLTPVWLDGRAVLVASWRR
jgi:hypothetical protein